MFKNYFRIAIRNIIKNRLTTFINIFGLGLSMSVGLMILTRTLDAFDVDTFHPYADRTFRVTSTYHKKNGDQWQMASTALPLSGRLVNDSETIQSIVPVYPAFRGKAAANGKEFYLNGVFTEPSFFSVFGFSLQKGPNPSAIKDPYTVVLSNESAEKFFPGTNAVGKVIQLENGTNYTITGIVNTPPGKSHLAYDAYASYSTVPILEQNKLLSPKSADWFAFNAGYTYILLHKNISRSVVQNQLNSIANDLNRQNKEGTTAFKLQPLSQISPGRDTLANDNAIGTSWTKIYIETSIALLILLAACFNYTNLTIAKALTRAKEVGIRKIIGARRSQVFLQYIIESELTSFLALAFAWVILGAIIQYAPFNDDYEFIPTGFHYTSTFLLCAVAYAVFTGLLAGAVPAWILSSFKPLRVLKNLSTARILGNVSLQKTLIVFQYSLSLVAIIFLLAFYKQFSFMAEMNPGFKRKNVLVVPLNGVEEARAVQQLRNLPSIQSVTASSAQFTKHFNGYNMPVWLSAKKEAIGLNYYFTDTGFVSAMQFPFVGGTNIPPSAAGQEKYILLNEKAARAFGFSSPEKAVGERLWINDSTQLQITGIVKDFHYENAGKPVAPLAFRLNEQACTYLYLTTTGENNTAVQDRVKRAMNNLLAGDPMSVSWLSDDLDRGNSQTATISLLGFLGFIALSIATLGLLGLVVYTVEVKGKEISVRKVIGAGEWQLVYLLSKGFIKLLVIAGCIAMPIGWLLSMMFLQNFSFRVTFGVLNIVFCFAFMLAIGLSAIISQTYKASTANPVNSLRTE